MFSYNDGVVLGGGGYAFSPRCLIAQILKAMALGQISLGDITEILLSRGRRSGDENFPKEFQRLGNVPFFTPSLEEI